MVRPAVLDGPRSLLFSALCLSIPAFYLLLTAPTTASRDVGSLLYLAVSVMIVIDVGVRNKRSESARSVWLRSPLDIAICIGAFASAFPTDASWSTLEWLLRSAVSVLIFMRLSMLLFNLIGRRHLITTLVGSAAFIALAGAGFYWLEPKVLNYPDGLWLAFITGATVGYGDLVPSTPASRIFAAFVVLFGYAVFSVVTASIAALFVGEDERKFEKELHADIRALREEVTALRLQLDRSGSRNG
jgi:voltage-gated potassium channel